MNGQFNLKTLEKSQQIIALFLLIISMFILISILIYTYLPSLFFFSSILNDYHYTAINKFTAGPISQLLIGSGFLLASLLLLTKHLIVLQSWLVFFSFLLQFLTSIAFTLRLGLFRNHFSFSYYC